MPGVGPAWGLLALGAGGQVLVEFVAAKPPAHRIMALALVGVVLAVNAVRYRHRRGQAVLAVALSLAAMPIWYDHADAVLSGYGDTSTVSAALNPALLGFGTLIRQSLRIDI